MATVIDTTKARPRHPEKQNRPETPLLRKPEWLRVRAPGSAGYNETRDIVRAHGLTTVCEEAACPNIGECWTQKHATMMIMGEICTRACAFCNVITGKPNALDPTEPARVAEAVATMGLKHVVITSVDRDDLDDGGAAHFAAVVYAIRAAAPDTTIEILTPDFLRKDGAAEIVIDCRAGRVQPQPRNRAAALSDDPPGRALLQQPAPARPGQGTRPPPLHQVRPDGRSRRDQGRGHAGDWRDRLAPGAWPTMRIFAVTPACNTGRGPSGRRTSHTRQARTACSSSSSAWWASTCRFAAMVIGCDFMNVRCLKQSRRDPAPA